MAISGSKISDNENPTEFKTDYVKDWYFFNDSQHDGGDEQLELFKRASDLLDRYHTALIQQERVLSMKSPNEFDMDFIPKYIASREESLALALALAGPNSDVWGTLKDPEPVAKDLVALRPRSDEDMFSRWMTGKVIRKFLACGGARFLKRSPVHGFKGYEESDILRITYNNTAALASALPVAAIAVLAYVPSIKAKLGIIAAFDIILSLCLTVFTTAKRTEVFASAAAFAAVQVVFVQGGMDGSGIQE